jgi:hypothetical protein
LPIPSELIPPPLLEGLDDELAEKTPEGDGKEEGQ